MPGKIIEIPGVGPATIYKRRGMRNIRISVSPAGKVRINLPKWAPYITGERFAIRNREWILKQLSKRETGLIKDGDVIGRGATVRIERTTGTRTTSKVNPKLILIRTPLSPVSAEFQKKVRTASERALKLQGEGYLSDRLAELAQQNNFKFKDVTVKRLTSRWGSCSPHKHISLSFFLMQLPDDLIDYVILHELTHTEQMNHGMKFWERLDKALPGAKQIRKQMRGYTPHLSGKGKFDNIDKADLPLA